LSPERRGVGAVEAERIAQVAGALVTADKAKLDALQRTGVRKDDVARHRSLEHVCGAVATRIEGFVVPDLGGCDNGCDGSPRLPGAWCVRMRNRLAERSHLTKFPNRMSV